MNIHVGLVAYALDIRPLVESIMADNVTVHCHLHSRIAAAVDSCMYLAGKYQERFDMHCHFKNRGLSVSWNDSIIASQEADAILILNDDLEMSHADLLHLAQAAVDHREAGIIVCEGYDLAWQEYRLLQYVAFAINPIALKVTGYFDQNCAPYCFEDSDMSRRLSLCGIPFHNAGMTGVRHLGSQSQTVPELKAQNQRTFSATADYYKKKWNGLPGFEQYHLPFNDPAFGWQIAASQRHDPYPGRGRTDLEEIVKL